MPRENNVVWQIINACNEIANYLHTSKLSEIAKYTGEKNLHNENIRVADKTANDIFIKHMQNSGNCFGMVSEELDEPIFFDSGKNSDEIVVVDPLDGSANVGLGLPVGTIFGIYKVSDDRVKRNEMFLQPARKLRYAGYALYGNQTIMIHCNGNKIFQATQDWSTWNTRQSQPSSFDDIKCPESFKTKTQNYAINDGNYDYWSDEVKNWRDNIINTGRYSSRYSGSLVVDAHRILMEGGIFAYPKDSKNKNGKLRTLYECNPMSFIFEKAGGFGSTYNLAPTNIHQKNELILGSKDLCSTFPVGF